MQDLPEVNWHTVDIHSIVPNPYTLLSSLPPTRTWYTALHLKDAFFCLTWTPQSQEYFAFEWDYPETGITGQLTWTRLPQGFKSLPILFDEALHRDLAFYHESNPQVSLLQYVDDLLTAAETEEDCLKGTKQLLIELSKLGYRAEGSL